MKPKTVVSVTLPIFIILAFLSAVPVFAQDTPATEVQAPPPPLPAPPAPPTPTRPVRPPMVNTPETALDSESVTVPLQYLDEEVLRSFATTLGVNIFPDTAGENVILSGPPRAIAKVQEFMKLLDVPPALEKNVLLTFYLVVTGKNGQNTAPKVSPSVMEELTKLLDTTLGTTPFCVWDTLLLRVRDNNDASVSGFLPPIGDIAENDLGPSSFQIQVQQVQVTLMGEEPPRIALDDLMCGVELDITGNAGSNNQPRPFSRQNIGFKSNLNIREQQMEIVGKTSISSQGDSVIIVVSAQVLKD